jgi:hypothetical protein
MVIMFVCFTFVSSVIKLTYSEQLQLYYYFFVATDAPAWQGRPFDAGKYFQFNLKFVGKSQ